MRMNEDHKEFVIECYAKFMKTVDIADSFMQEFENDLPQPPQLPNLEKITTDEQYEHEKQEYVHQKLHEINQQYQNDHPDEAEDMFHRDAPDLTKHLRDEYDSTLKQDYILKKQDIVIKQHNDAVEEHYYKIRYNLLYQFPRLNITHTRFPEKYRPLFNKARLEFFKSLHNDKLKHDEEIRNELETIYGYAKQLIFQEALPKDAAKHINSAQSLLKAIAALNNKDNQTTTNNEN